MRIYLTLSICFILAFSSTACKGQEQKAASSQTVEVAPAAAIHRVGLVDFKQQLTSEAQLLDVRTPEEYAAGHIEHALNYNINGPDFQTQVEGLDKSKPILVYCKMGGRSAKAAKVLKEMGFTTIYDLEGGYMDWAKQ